MWKKSMLEQASKQQFWINALLVLAFVGLMIFTFLNVMTGIAGAVVAIAKLIILGRSWRLAAHFFKTREMYRGEKRLWLACMMLLSIPFLLHPAPEYLMTLLLAWMILEIVRLIQESQRIKGTILMILGINFKWLVIVAVLFIMAVAIKPTIANDDYSPTKINAPQ